MPRHCRGVELRAPRRSLIASYLGNRKQIRSSGTIDVPSQYGADYMHSILDQAGDSGGGVGGCLINDRIKLYLV